MNLKVDMNAFLLKKNYFFHFSHINSNRLRY